MNIYEYDEYRSFLKNWIKSQPNRGRGLLREWSIQLRVHTSLLSQILNGQKDFSLEVATELCDLLKLTEAESDYFFTLVLFSKAGSVRLKQKLKKQIKQEQEKSKKISNRLKVENEISEEARAQFYTSWLHSGVRNLVALKHFKSAESISERMKIPRDIIQEVVEFLLKNNLLIYEKGQLEIGPKRTHLSSDSPLVRLHHKNWRERAADKMILRNKEDLFFSFPMSLSESDADKIRKLIPKWIEEIHQIVGPSPSETVRCLNIDFFEY